MLLFILTYKQVDTLNAFFVEACIMFIKHNTFMFQGIVVSLRVELIFSLKVQWYALKF